MGTFGGNRFMGLSFILTQIQGGFFFYAEDQLDAIKEALLNFQQKSDTKTALEISLTYYSGQVCAISLYHC